jgi:DNA-binding NarL/FixJ family response regulator
MDVGNRVRIVGRRAQLAALDRLADDASAGRGGLAWIEGEPGIGKTALADAVAERAAAAGQLVLRGVGDELMQPFPLRLMAECLGVSVRSDDPAVAEIAALLRGGDTSEGSAGPVLAAAERMLELVDRLCTRSPVTLVVEDLHWADEHSLLLWGRLARAVNQIPLLLIGSTRPLPQRDAVDRLRDLAEDRGGTLLRLEPLGSGEVAELAGRIAGATPGPRLAAELESAGGNPLYIREVVDALVGSGLVESAQGTVELHSDTGTLPTSLALAIGRRLGFLSEPTRRALRIAALLGNDVDVADWSLAAGRPVLELADLAAEAVAGGVLSGAGGRLRFRHELIRQALVEQTPQAVRSALHGSIARSLAESGRGVDAVARHLLTGPRTAEDWELAWLIRIGEPALSAALPVAAELLERAVGSVQPDDPRWTVLAIRLAQVLFWLGRDMQAYALARMIVHRADDPVVACRMRIQVIRLAGRLGRFREVLPMIAGPEDDGIALLWRARLAAWSALIQLYSGRPEEGLATARGALELAVASGDPLSTATAYHAVIVCGDPADRPARMAAALAALTSRDMESMDLRMMLLANNITLQLDLGRADACEAVLAEALRLAERSGTFRAASIQAGAVGVCYEHGRFDDALVHAEGIDPEAFANEEMHEVYSATAMIALHREDRATADAHLRAVIGPGPLDPEHPPAPSYPLTEALAMRAEVDGDPRLALALMVPWLDAPLGLRRQERHDDLPYLVSLALEVGDAGTAARAVRLAEQDAAQDPSPSRSCAARCCRALVGDDADELLALAEEFRGYRWILKSAFVFEQAAVRLARTGQIARARAALNEAVRHYSDTGATWNIKRADARLRRYGVRRGPRSVHRRATVGWEALTPSERQIAGLVARGRSNPDIAAELFLSRRTVQTHVSRILMKLQMHSRMDVIRAAAVHGALPTTAAGA